MIHRLWSSLFATRKPDRTSEISHKIPGTFTTEEDWTEEKLRQLFVHCADVFIQRFVLGEPGSAQSILLIYCAGMADDKSINEYVLPRLEQMLTRTPMNLIQSSELLLTKVEHAEEIISSVFAGQLVIYEIDQNRIHTLDIANPPLRTPAESSTELSIKGPRDGFIEDLQTNVALIRKRLRTNSLRYLQLTVGKRSKSKVAVLYIEDIAQPAIVQEVHKRLEQLELDVLFSSAQLEEALSDSSYTLFPLLAYTSRPDFVIDCLIRGRIAIIADGAPTAVIAPVNLPLLMKSPEDIYLPFLIVSFAMLIRFAGLFIALFLPGFWIALVAYNLEQIPFPLLATAVITRLGLPLPSPLEVFLMLGLFELFREAGVRLPKAVGQTIAVVGGIIVGDAVIRAGLASTIMLIVSAITAVATFTLVNQTLSSAVSIIRLFVMICATTLGMYGFILGCIAVVLYLSQLESFGVRFMAPLSPLQPKDVFAAIFKKPLRYVHKPPEFLQNKDSNPQGGNS